MFGVSAGIDELSSQGILEGEGIIPFSLFCGIWQHGKDGGNRQKWNPSVVFIFVATPPTPITDISYSNPQND